MRLLTTCLAMGMAALLLTAAARADEEKVPLDKVPKPVIDAVKAKFAGGELTGASKEVTDGKTVFEVSVKLKGKNIDVSLTPEGKITGFEKEIDAKDFPKAVKDALDAKYPGAKIELAEELNKDDKVTGYEAVIETADKKKLEIVFDTTGKITNEEKKDK